MNNEKLKITNSDERWKWRTVNRLVTLITNTKYIVGIRRTPGYTRVEIMIYLITLYFNKRKSSFLFWTGVKVAKNCKKMHIFSAAFIIIRVSVVTYIVWKTKLPKSYQIVNKIEISSVTENASIFRLDKNSCWIQEKSNNIKHLK